MPPKTCKQCADNRQLPAVTALPGGSYPSVVYANAMSRGNCSDEIVVRLIEYAMLVAGTSESSYRLLTRFL